MDLKIERNAYSFETQKDLINELYKRTKAVPPYSCPVEMVGAFLKLCHSESCGKCTPCRDGLKTLIELNDKLVESVEPLGLDILNLIKETATSIKDASDCAIGKEAGKIFLKMFEEYYEDYKSHALEGKCILSFEQPIPCVSLCPAHVDIPGYISLVAKKRYEDAIKLIRKDNPFPTACGLICEHPCESRCRRQILDDSINIRGIKRYAVDMCHANNVPAPKKSKNTNKKVAIVGGGPSGLTCAYFLSLMGHDVTVYDMKKKLGGMMRYGIPAYRFPRERLDEDIEVILSLGIKVELEKKLGVDFTIDELKEKYDAIYIAIGAHTDKKIKLEGQDAIGVVPAVELLAQIGDENYPDYKNKKVIVIGGGNVAMDVARSSIRLGASSCHIVYRRRKEDMTALKEEIESAIEEGVVIDELKAPYKILKDENNNVKGLETKKQMISLVDSKGRYGMKDIEGAENVVFDADIIIMATGQDIEIEYLEKEGFEIKHNALVTDDYTRTSISNKIFAGGDCVFGPATVIKAIQAGKVASKEIDKFLGYEHEISCDVQIPELIQKNDERCGRINMVERPSYERNKDFNQSEVLMCEEEMLQETNRCLRCDKKGCSLIQGGREEKW